MGDPVIRDPEGAHPSSQLSVGLSTDRMVGPSSGPGPEPHAEIVEDNAAGLQLMLHRNWLHDKADWWDTIVREVRWYRVMYSSRRFGTECETPCWTTFYGGIDAYTPYSPVPGWLQPLVERVSAHPALGGARFNAMLLRLYFDGGDEIAWHTDGRTFLGDSPTIASLSLGADVAFQLRRMHNVWPAAGNDGIDRSVPQREYRLGDGDLFAMLGHTQGHWHHRVPKAPGRRPRININFRYILPGPDAERGQKTYYKYMVHGDNPAPPSYSFADIMRRRGAMLNFLAAPKRTTLARGPSGQIAGDQPGDRTTPTASPTRVSTATPSATPTTAPADVSTTHPTAAPCATCTDAGGMAVGERGDYAGGPFTSCAATPPSWECAACTMIHEGERKAAFLCCEVCGTERHISIHESDTSLDASPASHPSTSAHVSQPMGHARHLKRKTDNHGPVESSRTAKKQTSLVTLFGERGTAQ